MLNRSISICRAKIAVRRALAAAAFFAVITTTMMARHTVAAPAGDAAGTISGTVSADQGKVVGFQVKARDTERKIIYTVFTRAGQYRVPNLPPGQYEVWVSQEGFKSAPQTVSLESSANQKVNLSITAEPVKSDAELVDYDTLYPPGPARTAIENQCMSCHGITYHRRSKTREEWKKSLDSMIVWGEGQFVIPVYTSVPNYDLILDYLATNFGPNHPKRELKLDAVPVDENEVANAIYTEYELPQLKDGRRRPHDPYVGPDGTVWFGDTGNRSVFQLNTKADFAHRISQEFQSPDARTGVHGSTVDSKGIVYYADIRTGYLGEVNPKDGEFVLHGTMPDSSMLEVVPDSKDNIWFDLALGNRIGKLDAKTRKISMWDLPTPDSNLYGLVVDHQDKIWTVAIAKHFLVKFDPVTEKFTEYKTPAQPSGPRRLGVDRDGNIWWSEYIGGNLGKLDPKTGKMVEYKLPLRYSEGYEAWPVGDDVWQSEVNYHTLIKFNRTSQKFFYYPLPEKQGGPGVPKMEVDHEGIIWFGFRGLKNNTVVAFKPKGNAIS